MAKYYAWTNFEVPHEDDPNNRSRATKIKAGDEVSADDLGISEDEFKSYIEIGAIRKQPHPDMGNFTGSPIELRKAELAAAAEGGYFDPEFGGVGTDEAPEIDPETGKKNKSWVQL